MGIAKKQHVETTQVVLLADGEELKNGDQVPDLTIQCVIQDSRAPQEQKKQEILRPKPDDGADAASSHEPRGPEAEEGQDKRVEEEQDSRPPHTGARPQLVQPSPPPPVVEIPKN